MRSVPERFQTFRNVCLMIDLFSPQGICQQRQTVFEYDSWRDKESEGCLQWNIFFL